MQPDSTSYETILASIADGVFTVDDNWNITTFNKSAERITGIRKSDALGQKCWEVFHADICEEDCALKKTMKTGRPCANRTIQIINNAGKRVPVSISTAVLKDENGKITGGVETFRDLSAIETLRKEITDKHTFSDIVTADHRMLKIFDMLPPVSESDSPVLILGESGTGKELLAKAIHQLSRRNKGPFIAVNCSALPDALMESELFGYKKGAFTDAKQDKLGRFDLAKGGTLFLDEIGDISKALQVKLLRVLQEKVFEPLGCIEPVKSDVRIITATNRNLSEMAKTGAFRKDLFYRIHVMPFFMPPLRERKNDIPLLVNHFIERYNHLYGKQITGMTDETMAVIMAHDFPGNVRELENILQHAFIVSLSGRLEKKHLPAYLETATRSTELNQSSDYSKSIEAYEADKIKTALEDNRFNRNRTAQALGIHPATLWRKMKRLNII
ncbi:MAG: sigma 54-interacting transcriptional regulator [Fibrobacteres bacterium]|nr:sigma 54-interacting transcriptional regulator [Fibrobacterota bacterium]